MASPIQVVLNPENFEEARQKSGGGSKKDFFAFRDADFSAHKSNLLTSIGAIGGTLAAQSTGELGYLKVILRREAWAKSHRPLAALFAPDRTPLVGGGDLGVMIFEVNPSSLGEVAERIGSAEETTLTRYDEQTDKEVPNPTAKKSETGAIEKLELYGPADKRRFSIDEAVAWLANPMTGGGYQIELFDTPAPRAEWDRLGPNHRELIASFIKGLQELGEGVTVDRLTSCRKDQPLLSVRLSDSDSPNYLHLTEPRTLDRQRAIAPITVDVESHRRLLTFLERHPLVRRIELPGIVTREAVDSSAARVRPSRVDLPIRRSQRSYPRLGIIDGGISSVLDDWIIQRWDILADEDSDHAHGTFIAGLAASGSALNGPEICAETDGIELVDIAVFPNPDISQSFSSYYPDGLANFFDEVEDAIADANTRHGVRIFNLSLNIMQPTAADQYSPYAARLDQIAEANNALLFISAGNTRPQDIRPEWSSDTSTSLANLAAARNDGLLTPAESARNLSIGALNPLGHSGSIPLAPARYSRRGPGIRGSMKPDLAHVGGSGTPNSELGHGLFSIRPDGAVIDGCGTSYAAPLVAITAAALDAAIEGEVSRETLIGLLVHHAGIPEPLRNKALAPVARHLVGFGMPPSADEILQTDDHSITLVFASRIMPGEQINFGFNWPQSLVGPGGKCRGKAKLTLASTPPLDPRFGAEYVRVNINAALQQEQASGGWSSQLKAIYLPEGSSGHPIEAELISHDMKWSPIKVFEGQFPRGRGPSSNWRLFVEYLTRAGEVMPETGVPFTALLTISDLAAEEPVFNEMRQNLQAVGTQIADIRTAARITPRV